jgi:hypothetical protein
MDKLKKSKTQMMMEEIENITKKVDDEDAEIERLRLEAEERVRLAEEYEQL